MSLNLTEVRLTQRDVLTVALTTPRSGPAGIFGPSCELSAQLAAEELNAADGAGGREIRMLPVDGGGPPAVVAAEVGRLISAGTVDAVLGWHISAVRQALVPAVACRVPYVYTAQYEGGERSPGVFVTGETPATQLFPAMRLLREARGIRSWYIVGNDYVWPRRTAALTRRYAGEYGVRIAGETFVPLGSRDFDAALRRIERSGADAVLELLVGQDAVEFNRSFGGRRLHENCLRLSTLMDENMLLGSGAEGTADLWVTSGYFETLATPESLSFGARYARRFGPDAPPVGGPGESCYEGLRLLAALAGASDTDSVDSVDAMDGVDGPRGPLRLRGNHVEQPVYLARADGLDFHVIARL
ncbi:MAG TPA: substrate-binding domain-containing protein [Trebonia sp.]|jgi:ABC-type branched-subunit amino acid transport system substrate-binding protein